METSLKLIYNKNLNLTEAEALAFNVFVTDSTSIELLFQHFPSSEFSFKKKQIEEIINLWQLYRYN